MKAIIIYNSTDGTIARGHKLDELFDYLPDDVKTKIESSFNKKLKRDLSSFLSEISTAFIEWRYAFESGVSINVTGILAFATSLEEYVDTIRETK